MEFDGKEEMTARLTASLGLRQKIAELQRYKALALALTRRYRPDMAPALGNAEFGIANAELQGTDRVQAPSNSEFQIHNSELEGNARASANTAPIP